MKNFPEFIAQRTDNIDTFKFALEEGRIAEKRLKEVQDVLLGLSVKVSIAHYSAGHEKEVLKEVITEVVRLYEKYFKFANAYYEYDYFTWLVSLSILCDLDNEVFEAIKSVIERNKMKDKLLNYLMKYKFSDWPQDTDSFLVKTRYSKLKEAIDATDYQNGISLLKRYLNDWYDGPEEGPWYNAHLNDRVNVYFGYWAWEAAALVKVKGWQERDEELKKSEYYPYRAVHW